MGSTRLGDHGRGEIEPDRVGTAGCGRGGEEPRSARDVQQARTGNHACGVEHGIHGLPGQALECDRIMRGGAFPSGVLEIAKLVMHVNAIVLYRVIYYCLATEQERKDRKVRKETKSNQ